MALSKAMKEKLEAMTSEQLRNLSDLMEARENGPEAFREAILRLNPPRPKPEA